MLLRSPWTALRSSWNHLNLPLDDELGSERFQRFAIAEVLASGVFRGLPSSVHTMK
jgi:hypothetical protein